MISRLRRWLFGRQPEAANRSVRVQRQGAAAPPPRVWSHPAVRMCERCGKAPRPVGRQCPVCGYHMLH